MKNSLKVILGLQHMMAMFGATILIPTLMGVDPALGLLSAGVGTLLYHLITKGKIPIFLGSSAAYLATFIAITASHGISTAGGALIGAAAVYFIMAVIVYFVGYKNIFKILPATVSSAVILTIGITLVPVSFMLSSSNMTLAIISALITVIYCSIDKGPFRIAPIVMAIFTGYIIAICMGIVDFSIVADAPWFGLPNFVKPTFELGTIGLMFIIGIVASLEHIGDLTTNSMITGKNHFKEPGLHRSFCGAGLSLLASSLLFGVPTTTYGENNGVLAITKQYDPSLIRIAAVLAIFLSFFGKFSAVMSTIPLPIIGGVSFVLFSMLAMSGVNTLKQADLNLMEFRHAVTFMVPTFIGVASVMPNPLVWSVTNNLNFTGISLAAIVGIGLNLLFELSNKIKQKLYQKSKI